MLWYVCMPRFSLRRANIQGGKKFNPYMHVVYYSQDDMNFPVLIVFLNYNLN